jgi:hypothetical protein
MTDRDTSQDTSATQVDTTTADATDVTAQSASAEPAATAATDVAPETASDGTPASTANGTSEAATEAASGASANGASEATPEPAPEATSEATSEATPDGAPEATSEGAPDAASVGAADSATEAAPEATAEAAPETTPETVSDGGSEAPSEAAPEATTDATPNAAPDAAPDAASDAGSQTPPEVTPEATADAAPDATPEATPDALSDSGPEAPSEATPQATPDDTPEAVSGAASDAGSEATTDAARDATPEAVSDGGSEAAPEVTPEATADAAPKAATPAPPVATPAALAEAPVAEHHEPVPPPTAAMPHTQPATAVPAAPVAGTPVAEASANPGKWGRVDADGTVYVTTADGERAVGSWHAGEPAEGLAHYARRFDDVRTEVELLVARLGAGSGDPKHTLTNAKHIKESLTDAPLVGDLTALSARLDQVLEQAQQAVESVRHARDEARGQALARKQELVAEVEKIAETSTQWKSAGDRLRAILDEWKTIKGVDRKTDDQLWKRFSKARDMFNRRRGSHFADLDRQRGAAKERKQELVKLAEEISDSDDWGPTAARYRDLMTEWKAAGRAPKEADDALWQQFRAAQDKFFSRRSSVFNERDAELVENAKRKEALIAEAEKINPASDLDAARAHLHRIQEKWDEVGKVPRERIRELEGKLRVVEDKVRNAADAQWRRTDPEAEARAAQFRERVEQFEAQAAKARASGDKRRAEQAEAQAAQWREWLTAAENAVASR